MHIGDYYGQSDAVVTSVVGSTGSVTLLPPDNSRIKVLFYNHSSAALFLKFGTGAALDDFSIKIGSGSYYETLPPSYTGSITGVWDAVDGSVKITKFSNG